MIFIVHIHAHTGKPVHLERWECHRAETRVKLVRLAHEHDAPREMKNQPAVCYRTPACIASHANYVVVRAATASTYTYVRTVRTHSSTHRKRQHRPDRQTWQTRALGWVVIYLFVYQLVIGTYVLEYVLVPQHKTFLQKFSNNCARRRRRRRHDAIRSQTAAADILTELSCPRTCDLSVQSRFSFFLTSRL